MDDYKILQDTFLSDIQSTKDSVCIYLINGIKLQGCIVAFDKYCIKIKNASGVEQMIYKHAISTLLPIKN